MLAQLCSFTGGGSITVVFVSIAGGGVLVAGSSTNAFVSTKGSLAVGVLRSQPWMSMPTRPSTLTASTQETPILSWERRRLCCSSREPWGRNGFGLFIGLAQLRPFVEVLFLFLILTPQNFPSKNSATR